jgi:hypothetical protein
MDLKTLESVRNNLSLRVSALVRESELALKDGEVQCSERKWEQMRGVRSALELVDSLITECDGL